MSLTVNVAEKIAPSFDDVFHDIMEHRHTHYWEKGGRGSTKSSFISIVIVLLLLQNILYNAVILRKVGNTLKTSVYNQILWAIEVLGLSDKFRAKVSPLEITYKPTGQKIIFIGCDDPMKIKSIKFERGYAAISWREELDQFAGMEEIGSINKSLLRGGDKFWAFYSFNPPKSKNNWVNEEQLIPQKNRLVHHSTYLDVPVEWLGELFIEDAEHQRQYKEMLYRWEYLGDVIGTGGSVFENVTLRDITDEELQELRSGYIERGIDWGFAVDPTAYAEVRLLNNKLYFLGNEIYEQKLSNRALVDRLKSFGADKYNIVCDSANPKDISELRQLGVQAYACYKGPGSVETGIKWLSDTIDEIIIDPKRNPNAAKEFINYEYDRTKDGKYISAYPDKNNHLLDCVRYSLQNYIGKRVI